MKKGSKHTEETRKRLSESHKGQDNSIFLKIWKNNGGIVWNKGKKFSEKTRKKMSEAKMGNKLWLGKKHSPETIKKLRSSHLGYKMSEETKRKISESNSGEKNYRWIKDRNRLKRQDKRNDPAYFEWRRQVMKRDKQCRLSNENCDGFLIVHHILRWADHPKERYNISNGITLCQAHHPRKRGEEEKLMPILKKMIVSATY